MIEINIKNEIRYFRLRGTNTNGKILIFLPGIGVCIENYILHLSSFKSYYTDIYSIDLPEQGSKGEWTIGNMSDNLREFISIIDNLNIKSIHLAGHSAGALAIISFIINYNYRIEKKINRSDRSNVSDIKFAKELSKMGFAKQLPEFLKVEKLILYAPPDSFNVVFPKYLSEKLVTKSQSFLKTILNIFINNPMLFFDKFHTNNFFKFKITQSKSPQYFKLIVSNHKRFFNYVSKYMSIFELFETLDPSVKIAIDKCLMNKQIMIQYGSIDWLIKPFFKRKKLLPNKYMINSTTVVKKQHLLGHFLNKKASLDINLNRQMITNKKVIKDAIDFIKSTK